MKKLRMLSFLVICLIGCSIIVCPSVLAKVNLKGSLERLDSIAGTQKKSELDEKLIKAIGIIDEMEEGRKWQEVGKLVNMDDFKYSKYFDELLYIYLAHLANGKKLNELESLWWKMGAMQNSIHIFPAMLIRLFAQTNQQSMKYRAELERIVEYIEMVPQQTSIHGPMIEGSFLFGYTVREDYSIGLLPKMYTMKTYMESPKPLEGFSNETQYVGILESSHKVLGIYPSRTVKLTELYEKGREDKKAAEIYYSLAKYYWDKKEYEPAEKYVKKALKNNPNYSEAKVLDKDIALALVLKTEGKPISPKEEIYSHDDSYLIPPGKRLTKEDLRGKSKGMLRLMRNEIFARYGRPFSSEDLHQYFTKKSWYKVNPDYSDEVLNEIDRQNILLLKEVEEGK